MKHPNGLNTDAKENLLAIGHAVASELSMVVAPNAGTDPGERLADLATMLARSLTLVLAHVCRGDEKHASDSLEATFNVMTETMNDNLQIARLVHAIGAVGRAA